MGRSRGGGGRGQVEVAVAALAVAPAPSHKGIPLRITFQDLKAAALHLKKTTGLNLLPTVARLAQWQTCAGGQLEL